MVLSINTGEAVATNWDESELQTGHKSTLPYSCEKANILRCINRSAAGYAR